MAKTKEWKVNVFGKPKHTLDVNRNNGAVVVRATRCPAATVQRLKMYNVRPKKDCRGKILKHEPASSQAMKYPPKRDRKGKILKHEPASSHAMDFFSATDEPIQGPPQHPHRARPTLDVDVGRRLMSQQDNHNSS